VAIGDRAIAEVLARDAEAGAARAQRQRVDRDDFTGDWRPGCRGAPQSPGSRGGRRLRIGGL